MLTDDELLEEIEKLVKPLQEGQQRLEPSLVFRFSPETCGLVLDKKRSLSGIISSETIDFLCACQENRGSITTPLKRVVCF